MNWIAEALLVCFSIVTLACFFIVAWRNLDQIDKNLEAAHKNLEIANRNYEKVQDIYSDRK